MINLDYVTIDQSEMPLNDNGFLSLMANLTRTGVFTYMEKTPDGTVRVIRQLRHPEEVFAEETLKTLMGLPTTNLHPSELVSTENAKELVVGMTSDTPKKISLDGDPEDYIQQQVTFYDKQAIRQIRDGERTELSLGYMCELEDSPGTWNGAEYDFIQRNISYNHLSLVDRARGGAQCKVLMDGLDSIEGSPPHLHMQCDGISFIETIERNDMKVFMADGKEFKVDDSVYELLKGMNEGTEALKATMDAKQADADKVQATLDALTAKHDAADNDDAKKKEKEVFDAAVTVRVELETKAGKIVKDSLTGLSDREIKEKVIKHIAPDVKLDGKSDAYVDASFDITVDGYKAPKGEAAIGKGLTSNTDGAFETSADAKAKQWARDKDLWKAKKK